MAKFKLIWPDGQEVIIEQSDCKTIEQYVNCRFGSQGCGKAKVTLVDETPTTQVKAKK